MLVLGGCDGGLCGVHENGGEEEAELWVSGRKANLFMRREERCVLAGRFCVEIDYLIFH